jgi:hypothetical protein
MASKSSIVDTAQNVTHGFDFNPDEHWTIRTIPTE